MMLDDNMVLLHYPCPYTMLHFSIPLLLVTLQFCRRQLHCKSWGLMRGKARAEWACWSMSGCMFANKRQAERGWWFIVMAMSRYVKYYIESDLDDLAWERALTCHGLCPDDADLCLRSMGSAGLATFLRRSVLPNADTAAWLQDSVGMIWNDMEWRNFFVLSDLNLEDLGSERCLNRTCVICSSFVFLILFGSKCHCPSAKDIEDFSCLSEDVPCCDLVKSWQISQICCAGRKDPTIPTERSLLPKMIIRIKMPMPKFVKI